MKRVKGGVPPRMAVVLICVFLITFNLIIAFSTFYMGAEQGKRVTNSSRDWDQEGIYFQYTEFSLNNMMYDLTHHNNTFPCDNESHSVANITPVIWANASLHFDKCSLHINGDLAKIFNPEEIEKGEGLVVPLGEFNVRKDQDFRMCCDNYCNGFKLRALCNG